ncbi:hypothetical protein RHSIM_Rhsim07G0065000 [Rhododendron simsii]|uniref:Beta-Casp domain-containing protein n=1 Tax=Rhododendron simsii TaxID=118357 RepID=A0A834GZK1_RHOSS|nr:hypothetical protein RHSIM_Rhsim07G0065000 [Rhododendron simsii]
MKLTCLSKGGGYHCPPCHIVSVGGLQFLLDCPLDLLALTIFSPIPTGSNAVLDGDSDCSPRTFLDSEDGRKRQKMDKTLDADDLIRSEPCYKTVTNLHLWDLSFIDVVLISTPMGMLGLPFLTRTKGFSAKIYATDAAARLGQLMMEDLISMNVDFRQFYGPEESSFPKWMKWEELEVLPSALKEIAVGKDGSEIAGWMPLYSHLTEDPHLHMSHLTDAYTVCRARVLLSAADMKDCMQKVQTLKYAEETCYNGAFILKAFSSGLEIGACNWTIRGPKNSVVCLSSSIFVTSHAMNFDYHALQGYDLILFSDFSLDVNEDTENRVMTAANNLSSVSVFPSNYLYSDGSDTQHIITESLLNTDDSFEEMEKLAFISSCIIDSVKAGGSALIPIGRLGIVLQLLEYISCALESLNLKVPIFVISSVAEELLAFSNVIPEWLCKQRQEKLYSGEPLFGHVDLIKGKKLHLFPALHTETLLKIWQEPCIVFSSHWSLRLGPCVHLLRRWCGDPNSLLVMEISVIQLGMLLVTNNMAMYNLQKGVDADLALLPFKPMAMKILQCSFLSGMKLEKVQPLLKMLHPKVVLFPENLRQHFGGSSTSSISFIQYSENETLRIPRLNLSPELDISTDLAAQLNWTKLTDENIHIARLKGELSVENGIHRLLPGNEQIVASHSGLLMHWGSVNLQSLVASLQNMGINAHVEEETNGTETEYGVHIVGPNRALININATRTVISTGDEKLASLIFEAITNSLDSI